MEALRHEPDTAHDAHLAEALRVLSLPMAANGLHWHPFGVYAIPLAKRTIDGRLWSRRLHLWHPDAVPVGEASPYGVHTHSNTARSHVLAGTLQHHLYAFRPDEDGAWQRATLSVPEGNSSLVAHVQAPTSAGITHTLPGGQPHGVTKAPDFAISLFEQLDGGDAAFTTWQRTDVEAEVLQRQGPVSGHVVARQALALLQPLAVGSGAGITCAVRTGAGGASGFGAGAGGFEQTRPSTARATPPSVR